MSLNELLSSLAGQPTFPGCRCRGRHHLFDPPDANEPAEVVEQRHAQALGLCQHCPALARCKSWLDGLPARQRPYGVIANTVRNPR
jgi:hypothetical protein